MSPALNVEVIRRDNVQMLDSVLLIALFAGINPKLGGLPRWLFWSMNLAVFVYAVVAMRRARRCLGVQSLRLDGGAQVALIGSEHGFSRFDAPDWTEDGDCVVVYGPSVSWKLIPKRGDEDALRQLARTVTGRMAARRMSTRMGRTVMGALVVTSIAAGTLAAALSTAISGQVVLWLAVIALVPVALAALAGFFSK